MNSKKEKVLWLILSIGLEISLFVMFTIVNNAKGNQGFPQSEKNLLIVLFLLIIIYVATLFKNSRLNKKMIKENKKLEKIKNIKINKNVITIAITLVFCVIIIVASFAFYNNNSKEFFSDMCKYPLMYMSALVLFVLSIMLLIFQCKKCIKKLKPEQLFVVIALVSGTVIACINPTLMESDGATHFLRAYDLSYGNIRPFYNATHDKKEMTYPENYRNLKVGISMPGHNYGIKQNEKAKSFYLSDKNINTNKCDTNYNFFCYISQAIGMLIGRLLNMNLKTIVIIMRIINLITFSIVVYFAIKIIPFMKNMLMVIALMPSVIYYAASVSPDSLLNAMCFLFVACTLRLAYDEKVKVTAQKMLILGGMLAAIFLCKYVYSILGLLILLVPIKKINGSKIKKIMTLALAFIPIGVIAILYLKTFITTAVVIDNPTGEMTQLEFVLKNKILTIGIVFTELIDKFSYYLRYLSSIGHFSYKLPFISGIIPAYILGTTMLEEKKADIKTSNKVYIFAIIISCYFAVAFGMYLCDMGNNSVGGLTVGGIQGRYFIPLLPATFILFNCNKVKCKISNYSAKIACISGCLIAYSVALIAQGYY